MRLESEAGGSRQGILQFEDDEWRRLTRARDFASEMHLDELMQRRTWQVELEISWERDRGTSFSSTMPPNEEIVMVLHRARPLILENEPTYLPGMISILTRRAGDAELRTRLGLLRELFSGQAQRKLMTIGVNDEVVNSESMLKTYLNAHEYHRDEGKQEKIAALNEVLPPGMTRGIFIHLLTDKLRAIRGYKVFVDALDGNRHELKL